jgi:hypothetical protein
MDDDRRSRGGSRDFFLRRTIRESAASPRERSRCRLRRLPIPRANAEVWRRRARPPVVVHLSSEVSGAAGGRLVTRGTAAGACWWARVRRSASTFAAAQSAPTSHPSSRQSVTPTRSATAAGPSTTRRSRVWRNPGQRQPSDDLGVLPSYHRIAGLRIGPALSGCAYPPAEKSRESRPNQVQHPTDDAPRASLMATGRSFDAHGSKPAFVLSRTVRRAAS